MTPKEIASTMKRLFGYETGGNDPWRHLMKDGELDRGACDRLLDEYIPDDEVIVFAARQYALQCGRSEASKHIAEFMKFGDVRVANVTFSSKVKISYIGVGQGFRRST
jgi:hypothetical protein